MADVWGKSLQMLTFEQYIVKPRDTCCSNVSLMVYYIMLFISTVRAHSPEHGHWHQTCVLLFYLHLHLLIKLYSKVVMSNCTISYHSSYYYQLLFYPLKHHIRFNSNVHACFISLNIKNNRTLNIRTQISHPSLFSSMSITFVHSDTDHCKTKLRLSTQNVR